jgi:hypothetical protein
MNSFLLELLAARAGGTANPALNDMLSRLRSAPGADPQQSVSDLLSQVGDGNPIASLLASQLAQSQTSSAKHESPVIEAEFREADAVATEQAAQASENAVRELRRQVESMFAELKTLRERTDTLAAALGACCLCWGQDPECRFCHGRGTPGFVMPDESLLAQLVLPAIRILQAIRGRNAAFSPRQQTFNPGTGTPVQGERLS